LNLKNVIIVNGLTRKKSAVLQVVQGCRRTKETAIPVKTPGQIHKWTCHKLESFSEFMESYARSTRKAAYCYLELFAGPGSYPCSDMSCKVEGSAVRIFKTGASFVRYAFLTSAKAAANSLRSSIASQDKGDTQILIGNPNNEKALDRLIDAIPRSASSMAFIDPGGYRRLNWKTLERLAELGKNRRGEKTELLIIFPLEMALLRNLVRPECAESVTRFYGNRRWEELKILKQSDKTEDIKPRLVELFKNGLSGLGYKYVEDYKPIASTHDPYYHLIYAGDSVSRLKQLKNAWGKSRFLRCELLYGIQE
jgi:three-Cys-motif partner protein